ncbi:tubulin--tyrosine ligase-like protein 12 [Citrus sinensis]|uniref:Tubulin--tyrosine ligase-like protein 12 n=2 Tax=Citrus sinensis TaxID=2711 RepID=A0ACB8P3H3_CITSI|nr:tubulin--tyrosine ligase-like protein 12 [Citrus sinensis]
MSDWIGLDRISFREISRQNVTFAPMAGYFVMEPCVIVAATLMAVGVVASGLPQSLHRQLFQKLTTETFDAGSYFKIEVCEDGRQRRLVLDSQSMPKESNVFLVDHAWTFRLSDAFSQLQEVPGLAQRMASLMCVDTDLDTDIEEVDAVKGVLHENGTKSNVEDILESEIHNATEKGDGTVKWLELEDADIGDDMLLSLNLSSKFPDLQALSLCGNKLETVEIIVQEVTKLKNLRALWLNNNPVLKKCDHCMEDAILQGCPKLEIYNSNFTINFGEWALGFCGEVYDKDNPSSLCLRDRPLQSVTSLDLSNRCIHNLVNKAFSPAEMPSLSHLNIRGNPLEQNSVRELLEVLKGFPCLQSLGVDIPGPLGESAIEILESLPTLCTLNGVTASKILEEGKHVIDSMLQPRLPEWSADQPLADRVLSAMWLYLMTYRLANEEKIDETSVWYVMDELGSAVRHSDEPNFREYEKHCQKLQFKSLSYTPTKSSNTESLHRSDGCASRVYTDIPYVEEFLTRTEFVITTEPKDADIIWTSLQVDEDMKKATGITDQQYVNQFPFESCLVMKHHLAETVQKAHGSPEWLQPTYNLETHLPQLIGDYYVRKRDGLNNLWILKPWNMARTIDTSVTDDLSAVIRLMETGPKICQKYIEFPALFQGRKFDLRYIVLVRSMDPLEIFLSDVFWVRLANNPYSLDKHSFFEYETHFTVMNYGRKFNHMNTPDFVREFEVEHQVKWLEIHQRVKNTIRSVFEAAAVAHPEMHSSKSRAMYGVDIMLDSSFQPKLLEVTYCPDCTRACKYDTEALVTGEVVKVAESITEVANSSMFVVWFAA